MSIFDRKSEFNSPLLNEWIRAGWFGDNWFGDNLPAATDEEISNAIRVWCSWCYRSIDVHPAQNSFAPCPYCTDTCAKLFRDPFPWLPRFEQFKPRLHGRSSGVEPTNSSEESMTTMNDLVERIFNAILRQEGMPSDWTNPGNLVACPWFPYLGPMDGPVLPQRYPDGTVVQFLDGFWNPPTRAIGIAGGGHCVALRIAEGQTLTQLISAWAPAADGNATAIYIANVKAFASIPDENVPLWSYITA